MRQDWTPPTLTTLAADLILCILEHLRPVDIISLRQTCTTMCEFTKLRMVWTNALRTVMKRHSIPEASMTFEAMTLSSMEHVALGPHRVLSLLQKSDGSSVRPMAIRVLSPRLTKSEKELYNIDDNDGLYDSFAESSGHFLASLSAYDTFTLFSVWDLGISGHDGITPLARYLEPIRSKLYLDGFWPGPQGSNFFYLVTTHESSLLTPLSVLVHRFSISGTPRISFIAKLEIPVPSPFILARTFQVPHTSKLVLQYEDEDDIKYIWVWDFVDNTVAGMIATDYKPAGKEMFLHYNDCILAAAEGCIFVYNIPPLLPRNQVNEPISCKATIIIAAPSKSSTSFFVGHDMAQNMPFYFSEVTPSRLTFFEVTSANQAHEANLPNKLPMTLGSLGVADLAFWSREQKFMAIRRCEDRLLLPSFNNTGNDSGDLTIFSAGIDQIFGGESGQKLSKTLFLNPLHRNEVKRRRFCPLLGRLCLHIRQRASYSRSVRSVYVLDYLGASS